MNKLKIARKYLARENKKWPAEPKPVPPDSWPEFLTQSMKGALLVAVWRSQKYLVQQYVEKSGVSRLTVCRTALNNNGQWRDNITWDELQWIKSAVGFGDRMAVEIFPADDDIVNVRNMRHLWILDKPLSFAWKKGEKNNEKIENWKP